jgi:FkbM family methyltransferase
MSVFKKLGSKVLNGLNLVNKTIGRPFIPLTRWMRKPLRKYFYGSKVIRHDIDFDWRNRLLVFGHENFVGQLPPEFRIYNEELIFQSTGTKMAIHGYYIGEIEYHLTEYVKKLIKPDFTFIDVGLHHGYYSLFVAHELKKAGWNGHIFGYEADPENYQQAIKNFRKNNLSDAAKLYNKAVYHANTKLEFRKNLNENSDNWLEGVRKQGEINPHAKTVVIEVEAMKLDELISSVHRVDCIKIDVQGAEPGVLAGAQELVKQFRPIIVIEIVQTWEESRNEIERWFADQSYTLFGVDKDGNLVDRASSDVFISWDCVALPDETVVS